MNKTDILTPIGFVVAFGLVIFGIMVGDKLGLGLKPFIDVPSLAITVGGSLGALLVTFTMDEIKDIPKALKACMFSTNINKIDLINQFKDISKKVRSEGVLALESSIGEIETDFLRKGHEYVVDGMDAEVTKTILETEISAVETTYARYSRLFKLWGSFTPAFGMVGTLIGLIQMLADLGDASAIAAGMGAALITTFYGALFANGIFNPLGFNVEVKGEKEVEILEMMMVGICSIQNEVSLPVLEANLLCYLNATEKKAFEEAGGA